jgi:hypothetical protein
MTVIHGSSVAGRSVTGGTVPRLVGATNRIARVEDGERMLIPCEGGPSISRLQRYPPPFEIDEHDGMYVLVDDGPPERWRYVFVARH